MTKKRLVKRESAKKREYHRDDFLNAVTRTHELVDDLESVALEMLPEMQYEFYLVLGQINYDLNKAVLASKELMDGGIK